VVGCILVLVGYGVGRGEGSSEDGLLVLGGTVGYRVGKEVEGGKLGEAVEGIFVG